MQKICPVTKKEFRVRDQDLEFYKKMDVPIPVYHPLERRRQRMAFRNQQFLHKRKCSWTGQLMVSQYPDGVRFPVIKNDIWYSDQYDPLAYGQDIDWDRPLMDQFYELQSKIPRLCVIQEGEVINSQYTQAAANNKNCYLLFSSNMNEDCLYGSSVVSSKNCMDGYRNIECELCYECVDVVGCYDVLWSQNSYDCNNSAVLDNCRSCSHCLYCVNLVGKEYHIWNKKVSKKEFEEELEIFKNLTYEERRSRLERFHSFLPQFPKRFATQKQVEDCTGSNLNNCRNAHECFGGRELEDCAYCYHFNNGKDCQDVVQFGYKVELAYNTQAVGLHSYNIRFCNLVWESKDLTYCDQCFAANSCWLSVGLKKNKYCILNKEYSKEEYEALVPQLQRRLEEEGQWGNFFPPKISTYGYNQSWAHEYFPLTKEEAFAEGYGWFTHLEEAQYQGPVFVIPEKIEEVGDDILDAILTCTKTGKNYRIVKPELDFYRKNNLPVPSICPEERHRMRVSVRMQDILYDRMCDGCQKTIRSVYAPGRPEKVLCEECYLKEVN